MTISNIIGLGESYNDLVAIKLSRTHLREEWKVHLAGMTVIMPINTIWN